MANFFVDQEFLEGFRKPYFDKRRHFIDLVSIGIVDDFGNTYYAISKDFNPRDASDWVKENVFKKIVEEFQHMEHNQLMYQNLWRLDNKTIVGQINQIQEWIGKSNKQIADDIREFVYAQAVASGEGLSGVDYDITSWLAENQIDFYGYFADYDWVLFCSLFGTMMDLPTGFPKYMRDLKQWADQLGVTDAEKEFFCPDPEKEHHALVDAGWNKMYYDYLKKRQEQYIRVIDDAKTLIDPDKSADTPAT